MNKEKRITDISLLEKSIIIWQKRYSYDPLKHDYNIGMSSWGLKCPLCEAYANDYIPINLECNNCPIAEKVNAFNCDRTPYAEAKQAHIDRSCSEITFSEYQDKVKLEVEFLDSVLKKLKEK